VWQQDAPPVSGNTYTHTDCSQACCHTTDQSLLAHTVNRSCLLGCQHPIGTHKDHQPTSEPGGCHWWWLCDHQILHCTQMMHLVRHQGPVPRVVYGTPAPAAGAHTCMALLRDRPAPQPLGTSCMHGTTYLHHALLTVADEQLQLLPSDQPHPSPLAVHMQRLTTALCCSARLHQNSLTLKPMMDTCNKHRRQQQQRQQVLVTWVKFFHSLMATRVPCPRSAVVQTMVSPPPGKRKLTCQRLPPAASHQKCNDAAQGVTTTSSKKSGARWTNNSKRRLQAQAQLSITSSAYLILGQLQ
jgi:hypothetical protein